MAVWEVTNTNDSGLGSLRQAILDANANANSNGSPDTIAFNIAGSGPHIIALMSALPAITEAVILDGYTQPGSAANTQAIGSNAVLQIVIDGSSVTNGNGLILEADNCTVQGLVLNGFKQYASQIALLVNSKNNTITGNFIGTNAAGSTAAGNGISLYVASDNNAIGGASLAARNLIAGSRRQGIVLDGDGNQVQNNLIGTQADGSTPLGNGAQGIWLANGASNNTIGGPNNVGNIIANNAIGIQIDNGSSSGNRILGNSILANVGLGIDLGTKGVTANDADDLDAGANGLQNFPVITSVSAGKITGFLKSTPNTSFQLELFANSAGGEGEQIVNSLTIQTDAAGLSLFEAPYTPVIGKPTITATVTNLTTFDTSEFSVINKAPVLTGNGVLAAISEDAANPPGVTLNSLFTGLLNDPGDRLSGVAVVGNPASATTEGVWQYSTNGISWANIGLVADDSSALALSAATLVRFLPVADFNGTPPDLTVRAIDGTYGGEFTGESRVTIDVSINGGQNPIASDTTAIGTSVTAQNDPPVVDLNGSSAGSNYLAIFSEGDPPVAIVDSSNLTVSDVDNTTLASATITITNLLDGAAEQLTANTAGTAITATYSNGVLTLSGADSLSNYQTVLRSLTYRNTSATPNTTDRLITIVTNDGSASSLAAKATVVVNDVNAAPIVDLNGSASGVDYTTTYTEGTAAVAIVDSSGLTADNSDALPNQTYSATVRITNLLNGAAEQLAADTAGTSITATYSAGVLTLTGSDSLANYQQVLRTVTYVNTSDNPDPTDRLIEFELTEAGAIAGGSSTGPAAKSVVTIQPVNDNPTLVLPTTAVSYVGNTAAIVLNSTADVTDLDSPNFATGTLTVSLSANGTADDRLSIRNQGIAGGQIGFSGSNITYSGAAIGVATGGTGTTPLVITFNANATPIAINALLKNITFRTVTATPATTPRTVSFVLTDGDGGTSTTELRTVNVKVGGSNTPPTISPIANQTISEDQSSGAIAFTIDDAESNPGNLLVTATSSNIGLIPNNKLLLGGTGSSRNLTLTPVANQSGSSTISLKVSDGVDITTQTFTVFVKPVNDAPTIAGTPVTQVNPGTLYRFKPIASDVDGDALTFTIAQKPTWATFNAATGELSGTPTAAAIGTTQAIQISVNDGKLTRSLSPFDLTVTNQPVPADDQPPVLQFALPDQIRLVGQAVKLALRPDAFEDPDPGDRLTLRATLANGSALPSWLTFNPTTATFTGRPSDRHAGRLALKVIARDRQGQSASDVFTLIVNGQTAKAPTAISIGGGAKGLQLKGTKASEKLRGSNRADVIHGQAGNDQLFGGEYGAGYGEDRLFGEDGNDTLNGGERSDWLDGGAGNDRLLGGDRRDMLLGGTGNDTLLGGEADDRLTGGKGDDQLTGGAGRDAFVFNRASEGKDTITDFNASQDVIDLRGIFAKSTFTGTTPFSRYRDFVRLKQEGQHTTIQLDANGKASGRDWVTLTTLTHVDADAVSGRNFVIV